MTIDKKVLDKTVNLPTFGELPCGTTFLYGGDLCLKINDDYAVGLRDTTEFYNEIDFNCSVKPVKCKIVLDEEEETC